MPSVDDLVLSLGQAREAYYNSDSPLMSDEQFDALEDELRALDPDNKYFSTVGHLVDKTEISGKIRHLVPMLSMRKAKNLDDAEKWLRRLNPQPRWLLTVQPKIDGLSASLRYKSGKLLSVATRGDGKIGQDISHVSNYIDDIPGSIEFTQDLVEVCGELHLPKNTRYDTGGRPLRNNCVGLINRKDDREDLRFVRFLAYQIVWPGGHGSLTTAGKQDIRFVSEYGKIEILKKSGFYTFEKWLLGSDAPPDDRMIKDFMVQIDQTYKKYTTVLRDEWHYETDGLILVVDDNRLHPSIDMRWVVDHHHHYALAFKPPSQAIQTPIEGITWQVSRQGNLTPVAHYRSVNMGGAQFSRASLHNAENVRRLRLAPGDLILVERANDVIPYVRDNLSRYDRAENFKDKRFWPEHCPSCGSVPIDMGVNMSCPNLKCRDRVLQVILYWVRQADMGQVALKTLESLYDAGKLRGIQDIYTLDAKDFEDLEGFGEKKINNFLQQVSKAKSMSPVALISRLGIPMVQSKSLAMLGISSMDDFLNFDDESYVTGERIVEWKREAGNLDWLKELLKFVTLEKTEGATERKGIVCLTGRGPVPRKTLVDVLEQSGWAVAGAVSSKTSTVLCSDVNDSSSKLKKARVFGIPILTFQDFFDQQNISF